MDHVRMSCLFFFLMIRRPPRSTLDRSSAASDVYKRQREDARTAVGEACRTGRDGSGAGNEPRQRSVAHRPVSYTHLRAHETVLDLVCRLLLEKKKKITNITKLIPYHPTHDTMTNELHRT